MGYSKRGRGATERDEINARMLLNTFRFCDLSQREKSTGFGPPMDGGREKKGKIRETKNQELKYLMSCHLFKKDSNRYVMRYLVVVYVGRDS